MDVCALVLLSLIGAARCYSLSYYETLIAKEIKRASTYVFPKDAGGFRSANTEPRGFGVFDFAVIGSGSAGSVVASRLSEDRNWTVLLLEAGGEENHFTEIPAMSTYAAGLECNWGFNSTPQTACCLAMGGVCPFPRGKSLGGTSAINVLVYSRGNKLDYERWSEDNPGWGYRDVLPYFLKSENSKIDDHDEGYHGRGGCLNVERHSPTSPKAVAFLTANQELGRSVVDFNGPNQVGAGRNQFNTIHGRRQSSAKAFLGHARLRPNLKIATHCYVTKLLVDSATRSATGVLFSHKGTQYVAKIRREVILSAGVVGSPTILMHSGIGPRHQLDELKIPTVQDLDVGLHMHDHLMFYNMYFTTSITDEAYKLRESIARYLDGSGPFTIASNAQAAAYLPQSGTNSTVPDVEVVFIPTVRAPPDLHAGELQVSQMVAVILHPKTRGRIFLQSRDPFVYPLIDSRCLSDEEDLESVHKAIEKVMEFFDTKAFRAMNATLLPDPRCANRGFRSREYWTCLIRLTAMNAYHGGGTCRMGPDPSEGAVVDNKLRVYGVGNLRVADTSVVPITLSGHMSAPAMMIGERAADFIKMEHRT
ncbi:hypothetical protein PPYR_03374 [Photinus pyralis]|uniref:Glucose-methanol-choline oxidoreductase N-terminal domain-containing protein n=2 Tax=Photinus pyralis TaxID=7054 RepID=A0A5N4A2L3_PHOPY|nr:glucose dehydrogenase [FAD, quinone]-like [Photinus pyralis]KAB0791574.1 hypothetical protein PPYR_03374 [Photinus pyralis]